MKVLNLSSLAGLKPHFLKSMQGPFPQMPQSTTVWITKIQKPQTRGTHTHTKSLANQTNKPRRGKTASVTPPTWIILPPSNGQHSTDPSISLFAVELLWHPAERPCCNRDAAAGRAGRAVPRDKIVCQCFVGGRRADAGRKTSCKDGKRRRERNTLREAMLAWETGGSLLGKSKGAHSTPRFGSV